MTEEQIARSMAYKNTFNSEHGKKVLDDLVLHCFGRNESILFDIHNERQTCYNLGKNSVLRRIYMEIDRNLTEPDTGKAIHKEV